MTANSFLNYVLEQLASLDGSHRRAMLGSLWAALSGGKCHFGMVKNKEWEVIDAEIKKASA